MQPDCFAPYDGSPCTCGSCVDYDIDHVIHPTEEDIQRYEEELEYNTWLHLIADSAVPNGATIPTCPSYDDIEDDLPF